MNNDVLNEKDLVTEETVSDEAVAQANAEELTGGKKKKVKKN